MQRLSTIDFRAMAEPGASAPAAHPRAADAEQSSASREPVVAGPVPGAGEEEQQQPPDADANVAAPDPPHVVDDGASTIDPLEVDFSSDSGFASDEAGSDTTSLASSLIRGHIENGRKYSTLRDDYWGPSDDQQFEVFDAAHLMYLLMEGERDNLLFRAPISNPKFVLDIGTGTGTWV